MSAPGRRDEPYPLQTLKLPQSLMRVQQVVPRHLVEEVPPGVMLCFPRDEQKVPPTLAQGRSLRLCLSPCPRTNNRGDRGGEEHRLVLLHQPNDLITVHVFPVEGNILHQILLQPSAGCCCGETSGSCLT